VPTDTAKDRPEALGKQLLRVVEAAEENLTKISELESAKPVLPGGWSRKQVLGHLIDSASNNHQRFVRAALQPSLDFPRYDQDGNIRVQAPQEADWKLLVSLWAAYNRYLAHIIARLPAAKLETACRIGPAEPVTLDFLAHDYLTHLVHHLNQIGAADSK
jgi:DinB superfamily